MTNRKFNLKPDQVDERDFSFKATKHTSTPLPDSVDLRPFLSPVVDQGSLGSCTANAIVSGFRENIEIKDGKPLTRLSRLFLYWHEREMEGTIDQDAGAYIRDGMKVLQTLGCPPESYFPYVESTYRDKPTTDAEAHAGAYKIKEYHRITSSLDLQHALAEGNTVVIGAMLYDSFYSIGKDGLFPMPTGGDKLLGGHAMLACGYKTINGVVHILIRNSWGTDWGDGGYCWMPIDYVKSINVTDMWTGIASIKPEDLTFADAIKHFVDNGIFDGPEFWANFEAKFKAGTLTNADFEYVFLGFRKIAAKEMNQA